MLFFLRKIEEIIRNLGNFIKKNASNIGFIFQFVSLRLTIFFSLYSFLSVHPNFQYSQVFMKLLNENYNNAELIHKMLRKFSSQQHSTGFFYKVLSLIKIKLNLLK
jgi:hypothetical protein